MGVEPFWGQGVFQWGPGVPGSGFCGFKTFGEIVCSNFLCHEKVGFL